MTKKRYNARTVTRHMLRKAFLEVQGIPDGEMDAVELSRRLCLLTEAQARAVAIGLSIVPTNTAWRYDILSAQTSRHDIEIEALSSTIMQVIEEMREQDAPAPMEPITQDDRLFAEAHAILEQIWGTHQLAIDVFQQTPHRANSDYVVLCYSHPELTRENIAVEDLLPTLRAIQRRKEESHA